MSGAVVALCRFNTTHTGPTINELRVRSERQIIIKESRRKRDSLFYVCVFGGRRL